MRPPLLHHISLSLFALAACACVADPVHRPDPFADSVVTFTPGPQAGFGASAMPDIVLGPPRGSGEQAGGVHVVSLGRGGTIVVAFDDVGVVDGPGDDLLVFENPFVGWIETGEVSVSEDGQNWHTWPCVADAAEPKTSGCAGVAPVLAHDDSAALASSPELAGGDAFDLADVGLARARFVRITDTGTNTYEGNSGGFDLDAVAVRNGEPLH